MYILQRYNTDTIRHMKYRNYSDYYHNDNISSNTQTMTFQHL